jgi:hypothetical protein
LLTPACCRMRHPLPSFVALFDHKFDMAARFNIESF